MKSSAQDLVTVVNEKDEVLNHLPRSQAHKKGLLHRTIGVIILNDQGQILLQKRVKNKDTFPDMYTVSASGHVDFGESYEQAAKREIWEELGIKGELKFLKTLINDPPEHRQMQSFYLIRNNGPFKLQYEEVSEARFFTIAEVKKILPKLTPTVKIALELLEMKATAIAPTNIAFTKYWGKKNEALRLPENGSISMTLSNLLTTTTVEFSPKYKKDEVTLLTSEVGFDSSEVSTDRVIKHLDRVREMVGISLKAKVVSNNNFPMGTGLSSSASGFAALSVAAAKAAGLTLSEKDLSILTRQGSGSACRSIPGGFVEWLDGNTSDTSYAKQIFPPNYWTIADVVALVSTGKKEVSSSLGMKSATSSPFMKLRLSRMKQKNKQVKEFIKNRDFKALGELTEQEALELHTIMLTQYPPLIYWTPGTLQIMKLVSHWRKEGIPVYFTINTGQDIHLIVEQKNVDKVKAKLKKLDFVKEIIVNTPGEGTRLSSNHLF